MLAELGHVFLIAGVATSLVSVVVTALSLAIISKKADAPTTPSSGMRQIATLSSFFAVMAFALIFLATLLLAHAFIRDDFSIAYVAQHSNSALPNAFKIAAVWGGHEGSFLFMLLTLSGWSALLAWRGNSLPIGYKTTVMTVLAGLVVLFGGYCLWLSNPFVRQIPAVLEGRDLHPMLQDIGLIFHPPLLYLGYIGFAVPFAFSVAAMITNTPPSTWVANSRRWTTSAWALLTAGIAVGSWWAYHELGWGGWWFWDPVENASLLPWLTATALLHCLIATQRDNALIGWTLLLSIATFSLSILGTFIVRSGVLISVHAFGSDPLRGTGLLIIVAIVLLISLLLFATKASALCNNEPRHIAFASREFWMMCGAALLVTMALIVMLGTFYPMIYASLGLGTLSVGAPYFNSLLVPLALVLGLLAAFGSLTVKIQSPQLLALSIAIILSSAAFSWWLATIYAVDFSFTVMLAIMVATALSLSAINAIITTSIAGKTVRLTAMFFGHVGLALLILGAAIMSQYSNEISMKMRQGISVNVGPYTLTHQQKSWHIGPNYTAERRTFSVDNKGGRLGVVSPEKRHYTVRTMDMSEAGILSDGLSDIYVTLGTKFDADNYAVRVQSKPLVKLLWFGSAMMMFAGFLSAFPLLGRWRPAASMPSNSKPHNTPTAAST